MDDLTSAATLDVFNLDATPIQRMPAIMNLDFLPDMGRMNGKLPSAGATGCSPGRCALANVRPQS
ncbi:hypothetical protein F6X40_30500 [Paraburkholderia sp. UCT31]|uniref:hypothetical protein n=1 Tax=Paraburkholderia sp. UCT31 TaxID=2615209 RepID=UPI001654CC0F|nr:hypothetical protein [Paraburkholderia sp. UCT31]MBC8740946.1 hypothetical protein [Paraburkholderia sp. UCT31]